jgi:hypothetical protein
MKIFFQLAFVCSVGLFGCGSQTSRASRVPVDSNRIVQPVAARVTTMSVKSLHSAEVKAARPF